VTLKQQVAKLILQNEQLMRETSRSSQQLESSSDPTLSFHTLKVTKRKDECVYYTGFSKGKFTSILSFLVPDNKTCPFSTKKNLKCFKSLSLEDQLLLVLVKLRQNFDFVHLGKLFKISSQDCSSLFSEWIQYMYFRFSSVSIWPHRDTIIGHMPKKFRKEFPNTLVIIDGTEIKIEKPSSLTRQSQCYSDYKSCTTLKGLVGIDPRGSIIFSSMLFTGNISDNEITRQSGFYNIIESHLKTGKILPGDGVMADKGFRIIGDLKALGLELNIPPFTVSGTQMKDTDVELTEKIARHRVHVERAIARVKQFKILGGKVKLGLFSIVNQIWFSCCFLTNFMSPLINDDKL
jgi:hypothetical protein